MRNVYVVADNIFSPLGKNTRANMDALKSGKTGIQLHQNDIYPEPFFASLFSPEDKYGDESISAFESIVIHSASEAMQQSGLDPGDKKNGFILSTTKGNISLIENLQNGSIPESRVSLNTSADIIAKNLGFSSEPLVVSHACISGLLAIITGMRLIQSGIYENLVISGGDLITSFIYSGFQIISGHQSKSMQTF